MTLPGPYARARSRHERRLARCLLSDRAATAGNNMHGVGNHHVSRRSDTTIVSRADGREQATLLSKLGHVVHVVPQLPNVTTHIWRPPLCPTHRGREDNRRGAAEPRRLFRSTRLSSDLCRGCGGVPVVDGSWQGWQTTRVLRRILAMRAAHAGWSGWRGRGGHQVPSRRSALRILPVMPVSDHLYPFGRVQTVSIPVARLTLAHSASLEPPCATTRFRWRASPDRR